MLSVNGSPLELLMPRRIRPLRNAGISQGYLSPKNAVFGVFAGFQRVDFHG
jgi:hypothetical protein